MARPTLRVCALYPDLMNIYADRGNLLLLQRRCEWRGIGFELTGAGLGDTSTPTRTTSSTSAAARIATRRCAPTTSPPSSATRCTPRRRAERCVFAVCGGYQLLGHAYEMGDEGLPGVGLVDLRTVREDGPRLIGNVAIEVELPGDGPRVLAGFENHGGRTRLGPARAAARQVLDGHGNNGRDGYEGVRGARTAR